MRRSCLLSGSTLVMETEVLEEKHVRTLKAKITIKLLHTMNIPTPQNDGN